MGAFATTGRQVVEWLHELAGRRIGLAVSEEDLRRSVERAGYGKHFPVPNDAPYRMHSEEAVILAYSTLDVLGSVGAWRSTWPLRRRVLERVGSAELTDHALEITDAAARDPATLCRDRQACAALVAEGRRLGGEPLSSAVDTAIDEVLISASVWPWSSFTSPTWTDVLALEDLFKSESTIATHGRFFDQRFTNFLVRNFEEIGSINWRKFEALVGEYLWRAGFDVELGPGRNDDGVDLRAWERGSSSEDAPLIIVQCKRHGRKIDKVTVKALAADVRWHGATVGLLVASTDWSPGARSTALTRSYPVQEVNRDSLRSWIRAMHRPLSGLWTPGGY